MDFEEVQKRVNQAVKKLLESDSDVLERDVNERTITHRLANYLEPHFQEWDVDVEYNRDGIEPKRLGIETEELRSDDTEGKTVYPDIIIHERNRNERNLLVIEVKKSSCNEQQLQKDHNKIVAFIKSSHFNYQFGYSIVFKVGVGNSGLDSRSKWFSHHSPA